MHNRFELKILMRVVAMIVVGSLIVSTRNEVVQANDCDYSSLDFPNFNKLMECVHRCHKLCNFLFQEAKLKHFNICVSVCETIDCFEFLTHI